MSTQTNINQLFIIAARKKYRFGNVTVEDLFDLNLSALDTIAVTLDEKIQKAGRKSFVEKRTASTTELENQLEIVKFVIDTKQTEAEEKKNREKKAAQLEFLHNLKKEKELKQLEGLSIEEIDKQIAAASA